jgi:hypothetical protein
MTNKNPENDKAKFLEALEKKHRNQSPKGNPSSGDSKVRGGKSSGNTQKIFRRKSGSS